MLIKFKKPDPRAGTVAQMDSSRGQQLIDAGAADRVAENGDAPRADPRAALDAALESLPGENTDPDYVVRAMRSHFGAVFTDADEARVREVVVAPVVPTPPPAPADEAAAAPAPAPAPEPEPEPEPEPAPSDTAPAAAPEPAKPTRSRK